MHFSPLVLRCCFFVHQLKQLLSFYCRKFSLTANETLFFTQNAEIETIESKRKTFEEKVYRILRIPHHNLELLSNFQAALKNL